VSKMNRRRFLSGAAGGAGAVLIGCNRATQEQVPIADRSTLGSLATTTRPPITKVPDFSEDLLEAPQFRATETCEEETVPSEPRTTVQVRMIIRGLCAVVIWEDTVDIVLMDARKMERRHGIEPHVGKFTVEDGDRLVVPINSSDPLEAGKVENDDSRYAPIRAWDIRGSIVTIATETENNMIEFIDRSDCSPWSSMKWQLDFERVYDAGVLRDRPSFDTSAGGVIAGVLRLTHGYLESVLPGRRYGNTGIWRVFPAGATGDGSWRQALTDTLLYTLDVAPESRVTLNRRPLGGYDPGSEPVPRYTPITLKAPALAADDVQDPLPCGLSHEPALGEAQHKIDLHHNEMFYELFRNAPNDPTHRRVPTLVEHWVDRGMGREGRSAYWGVTRDGQKLKRNVCDPNCNMAVFGLKEWRKRQKPS
jgi:hypothetical protein